MHNQIAKIPILLTILSTVTSTLIILFLAGWIIEIPRGTREGGVMGAIGVAVIIAFMVIIGIVTKKLVKSPKT